TRRSSDLLLGEDRLDRALGLAQLAVDALLRIDGEEVRSLVETVDRAYLHAIHVLALDAVFGDDKSHSQSSTGIGRLGAKARDPRREPVILPRPRAPG